MIYQLTAIRFTPGGRSTVNIYTQTIHRTTQQQNNTNNKQNNKFGRVLVVPSLCEFYPGICLTTEEKARKTLTQGSRRDSKYTHYQDTHTLQNPNKQTNKHTHTTHTHTHITKQFKTIRVQIKTNSVPDTPKMKRSQYKFIKK
jgi:hypothetical protein